MRHGGRYEIRDGKPVLLERTQPRPRPLPTGPVGMPAAPVPTKAPPAPVAPPAPPAPPAPKEVKK